eukprot:c2000_g1_i1 orf=2-169(-)
MGALDRMNNASCNSAEALYTVNNGGKCWHRSVEKMQERRLIHIHGKEPACVSSASS